MQRLNSQTKPVLVWNMIQFISNTAYTVHDKADSTSMPASWHHLGLLDKLYLAQPHQHLNDRQAEGLFIGAFVVPQQLFMTEPRSCIPQPTTLALEKLPTCS